MFKQWPLSATRSQEVILTGLFLAGILIFCQSTPQALAMHDDFLFGEAPDVKAWDRELSSEEGIAGSPLLQEQRQAIFALYLAPVILGDCGGKNRSELARRARSALTLLPDVSAAAKRKEQGNLRKKTAAAATADAYSAQLGDSLRFLRWRLQYFIGDKSKVAEEVKVYLAKRNGEAAKQGALLCSDLLALSCDFGRQQRYLDEANLAQFSQYLANVQSAQMSSQRELDAVKEYERHVAEAYTTAQLDRRQEASEHFSQAINYLRPRSAAQRPQMDGLRKALLRVLDEDLITYENNLNRHESHRSEYKSHGSKYESRQSKYENDQTKYENDPIKYDDYFKYKNIEALKERAVLMLNNDERQQLKQSIDRLVDIAYIAKLDGRLGEAAYLFRRAFLLVQAYFPREQKDYSGLCYDLGETLLWDEKYDDSVYYLGYCVVLRSKDDPLAVSAIDTNNLLGRARLAQGQAKKALDIFFDNLAGVAKRVRVPNTPSSISFMTDSSPSTNNETSAKTDTNIKMDISTKTDTSTTDTTTKTDISSKIDTRANNSIDIPSNVARDAVIHALLAYYPSGDADARRQIEDGLQGIIDAALPLKQYDLALQGGEWLLKLRSQAESASDAGMMSVLWGLAYACDCCARPERAIKYYTQLIDSYSTIAPTSLAYWYHGRGVDYDLTNRHNLAAVDVKKAIVLYQKQLKIEKDEGRRDHLSGTVADLQYNLKIAKKYPVTRPDYASLPDNCRWRLASFPLKIFIGNDKQRGFGGELYELTLEAVSIWTDYDRSPIKIAYVDKLSDADVFIERVTVYDDIPSGSAGRTSATYEHKGEVETKILTRAHVRVYCPSFDGNDWENQTVKMSSFAKTQFKFLLVHELGHVFGLSHSPAGPDIMYWKSCSQKLSDRDMNSIKSIYNQNHK